MLIFMTISMMKQGQVMSESNELIIMINCLISRKVRIFMKLTISLYSLEDDDSGKSFIQMDAASGDDYYDNVDSGKKKSSSNGKSSKSQNGGLKDCISLLGII